MSCNNAYYAPFVAVGFPANGSASQRRNRDLHETFYKQKPLAGRPAATGMQMQLFQNPMPVCN
jgi:hypothetical protein